ncbi:MAG TPA: ribose-phosphate diphosphokinase [Candidatus Methylomirabilis sp.]|nr:ribose-phosphate diphosphokinase [Candidatus Methylomirabilis sp.]
MSVNIILNSTSRHFAKSFANKNFRVFTSGTNKDGKYIFPDGEVYARLDNIEKIKGRTIIIHSGAPDPSGGLVELEMLLSILRQQRVKPIEIFFTYFPYGRQDKSFLPGEANTVKDILDKLTKYYQVRRIYIVDPHFGHRDWLKNYPVRKISAFKLFKDTIVKKYPGILFLSADNGQAERSGISGAKKKRANSFEVKFQLGDIFRKIKGKNICLVDDLIETGGTLVKLAAECRRLGAKKIIVFVTHGVLPEGIERVSAHVDEFYTTNSIGQRKFRLDIGGLIGESISKRR